MAKKKSAKTKRNELLAALQTAEKQVKGLRELLGLPPRGWMVDTQQEVAAFFGVSDRTINAWRRAAPYALPGDRGQYNLKSCFEWWLIHGPGRRGKGRPPGKNGLGDEFDPLMEVEDSTPALERWRLARAKDAEISLAERRGEIVSVELFQRVVEAAFVPLRRFAEEQIKEHGNGTADAWTEAVEQFTREVESVIGQSVDTSGTNPTEAAAGPPEASATDAAG